MRAHFKRLAGMIWMRGRSESGQNGGQRNCQGRDMSQRVEVRRACAAAHPQPFLTCGFEAGIVALALCTQGVSPFKGDSCGQWKACSHRERSYISCSLGFSSRCSNSCGCRDIRRFWIGGRGSSISGGHAHCWSFCRPCAWRTRPRRPDYRQEVPLNLSYRVD